MAIIAAKGRDTSGDDIPPIPPYSPAAECIDGTAKVVAGAAYVAGKLLVAVGQAASQGSHR
jgi:hypothetical protein